MTTFMAGPQPLGNFPHQDPKADIRIELQIPSWYGTAGIPEGWGASSGNNSERGEHVPSPLHNPGTSICSQTFMDNQRSLAQRYHLHSLENDHHQSGTPQSSLQYPNTSSNSSTHRSRNPHSAPAIFPTNYNTLEPRNLQAVSSLQTTNLEQLESADPSPTHSVLFYDGFPHEPKPSRRKRNNLHNPTIESKHHPSRTLRSHSTPSPPQPPARHHHPSPNPSSNPSPPSARTIYLAKNRHAASKCRTKQKRQQEDLVIEAREVERLNKLLKAEVGILKQGMRELMEVIGSHAECPDGRLRMYVQREAGRLVRGGNRGEEEERRGFGVWVKGEEEGV